MQHEIRDKYKIYTRLDQISAYFAQPAVMNDRGSNIQRFNTLRKGFSKEALVVFK